MQRVGILGGSFNPVHLGHLVIAEQARQQANLDRVLWLPNGQPPHKQLAPGASSADRWQMVNLAIATTDQFSASDLEITRPGYSYAVDTLTHLRQTQPDIHWHWIIGADALKDLPQWHRASELAGLCDWIVAPRLDNLSTIMANITQTLALKSQTLEMPVLDLSSTLIREFVAQGRSIRYLVPETIATYIQTHQLYRQPSSP
ncbi:MAG: nicotinate-nucleotide adenylyltransferase [Synechococcaceae cyanobacterium SM2_3_60]|nr:nicotinate-nucleotide adenylyltransferase [Synechococcaceae cyanobacterium SM2_3_60]